MRYANQRLIEEMCKEEPYRLSPNGQEEAVSSITPQSLYEYYKKALLEDEIDLYIVGDVKENALQLVEKKYFFLSRCGSSNRNKQLSLQPLGRSAR
ncbi:hypothetical protein GCM10020331_048910 [Ectobacillus funiculus]